MVCLMGLGKGGMILYVSLPDVEGVAALKDNTPF